MEYLAQLGISESLSIVILLISLFGAYFLNR